MRGAQRRGNLKLTRYDSRFTQYENDRGKLTYFVARAVCSRAYILINNSAGDMAELDGKTKSFGSGALVIDPLGQVVARTTEKDRSEKIIFAILKKPLSVMVPEFEMDKIYKFPNPQ